MMISRISGYTPASYTTTTKQTMSAQNFGRRYDYENHQKLLEMLENPEGCYDANELKRLKAITQIPSFTDYRLIPLYLNYIKKIYDKECELTLITDFFTRLDDDDYVKWLCHLYKDSEVPAAKKSQKAETKREIQQLKKDIDDLKKMKNNLGNEIFAYEKFLNN